MLWHSRRGLATQCRMTPSSKYAVDTRRMIATGKVRQGIKEWPQTNNYPNKELLGRYDLYPDPGGKEKSKGTNGTGDPPPPGTPSVYPQQGAVMPRLCRKTEVSGVPVPDDKQTNKNKPRSNDRSMKICNKSTKSQ